MFLVKFQGHVPVPVKRSREVGVLLAQAASSSAQRQWRSLGARSMHDARSFMISTLGGIFRRGRPLHVGSL